jgi:hypothetical protein
MALGLSISTPRDRDKTVSSEFSNDPISREGQGPASMQLLMSSNRNAGLSDAILPETSVVTCVPLAVRLRVLLAEPRFIYRASSLPRTQLVVWPGMCLGRSSMALISLYIHQLTLFWSQTSVELSSCGGEVGCKKPLHAKKNTHVTDRCCRLRAIAAAPQRAACRFCVETALCRERREDVRDGSFRLTLWRCAEAALRGAETALRGAEAALGGAVTALRGAETALRSTV